MYNDVVMHMLLLIKVLNENSFKIRILILIHCIRYVNCLLRLDCCHSLRSLELCRVELLTKFVGLESKMYSKTRAFVCRDYVRSR